MKNVYRKLLALWLFNAFLGPAADAQPAIQKPEKHLRVVTAKSYWLVRPDGYHPAATFTLTNSTEKPILARAAKLQCRFTNGDPGRFTTATDQNVYQIQPNEQFRCSMVGSEALVKLPVDKSKMPSAEFRLIARVGAVSDEGTEILAAQNMSAELKTDSRSLSSPPVNERPLATQPMISQEAKKTEAERINANDPPFKPLDDSFQMPKGKPLLYKDIQLGATLAEFKTSAFPGTSSDGVELTGTTQSNCPDGLKRLRQDNLKFFGGSLEIFSWVKKDGDLFVSAPVTIGSNPANGTFWFIKIGNELRLIRILLMGEAQSFDSLKQAFLDRYGNPDGRDFGSGEIYKWGNSASNIMLARLSETGFVVDYKLMPAEQEPKFDPKKKPDL